MKALPIARKATKCIIYHDEKPKINTQAMGRILIIHIAVKGHKRFINCRLASHNLAFPCKERKNINIFLYFFLVLMTLRTESEQRKRQSA
mmetsp:Transcript_27337/g.39156  ORF Transcript_27337/g.39156 Transcript_27337/m.39156 type:complete len:90 (+) Transcript_27337:90-359(+)